MKPSEPLVELPDVVEPRAAACAISFGHTAGLRTVVLSDGVVRAEVLLDKGANVRQVWHLPTDSRALAEADGWETRLASFARGGLRGNCYSDFYEGGWQDVTPARARWADGEIDGGGEGVGEAAIVPWELSRWVATPDGAHVACSARLPRTGLELEKRFSVRRGVGTLRVETTVHNVAGGDVHLSRTEHPAFGGDLLDGSARVHLPGGAPRVRCPQPRPPLDGQYADAAALLPPFAAADRFETFADVGRGEAELACPSRGVAARLRWDASAHPHAWLWCARRAGLTCIAIEPSTTYLPEALPRPKGPILRLLGAGQTASSWIELSLFTASTGLSLPAPVRS